MKKLSEDLKKILTGLAHQDAGEFLSMREKMKELGMGSETREQAPRSSGQETKKRATHRVAFITDGRGVDAPLSYAIDACLRQGAKIDLLIPGSADAAQISVLENKIRLAGLEHHRIQLGLNPVESVVEYICNHSSLIYLVAMPDEETAKVLIDEVIPKRGGRIPVPLVLIEDRPSTHQDEQSAA